MRIITPNKLVRIIIIIIVVIIVACRKAGGRTCIA